MNRCNGIIGFIFGHKFEPRYSTKEIPNKIQVNDFDAEDAVNIIEANKTRLSDYHNDICTRCGIVIDKQNRR